MSALSKQAYSVVYRKLMYAEKALGEENITIMMRDIAGQFDYYRFQFDVTLSDTLFSSLAPSLIFGIPLSEMGFFFDFRVELPAPSEFVRGLLIKVVKESASGAFKESTSVDDIAKGVMSEEAYKSYIETRLEKGVYGKSRYGYSYYDPPAVREFLRSTMLALSKKRGVDQTIVNRVFATARALGIKDELVEDVVDRLQRVTYSVDWCTLDYSYVDNCTVPQEDEEGAWIAYIGHELKPVATNTQDILDDTTACILDVSLVDACFVGGSPDSMRGEDNLIVNIRDYLVRKASSRLITTPLAVANYQRTEELKSPRTSIRTEQLGLAHYRNESIRDIVRSALAGEVSDPYTLNLYSVAVEELVGKLTRPRGWGDEAYRAMSRGELLESWVSKWASQGLRGDLLERLFNIVYDTGIVDKLKATRKYERDVVKMARGVSTA